MIRFLKNVHLATKDIIKIYNKESPGWPNWMLYISWFSTLCIFGLYGVFARLIDHGLDRY